jgi:RecA-family ATPase
VQASLGRLAREINGAVLACAHPSRGGLVTGSGESGSTAWDATFRSRLYQTMPPTDGDAEPDQNARILARKKANYAVRDDQIGLTWQDGVFVANTPETSIFGTVKRQAAERVFLNLLDRFTRDGRPVSDNPRAGNYAPRMFAKLPDRDGCTKKEFVVAMETLFAAGAIKMEAYGRASDERRRIVREGSVDEAV